MAYPNTPVLVDCGLDLPIPSPLELPSPLEPLLMHDINTHCTATFLAEDLRDESDTDTMIYGGGFLSDNNAPGLDILEPLTADALYDPDY